MSDLTKEEYAQLKQALDASVRPLFFFDDDPDGVAAYLTLLRYKREGMGVIVKTAPRLTEKFLYRVQENLPDCIFSLDLSDVEQEFINKAKTPIYMMDHHKKVQRHNLHYFNPLLHGEEPVCTSHMAYNLVGGDLWLPLIGIIGDWTFPPIAREFQKENPDLLPPNIDNAADALFASPFGTLVQMVSFAVKGRTKDTFEALKCFLKVKDPREILNQTTKEGKFIFNKTKSTFTTFDDLFSQAVKKENDTPFIEFLYPESYMSLTKDLSNRLLHRFPQKVIIVGREKSGDVKLSLRCSLLDLRPIVESALSGLEGYGGGHAHACGACISSRDYPVFIQNVKQLCEEALAQHAE